MTYWHTFAPTQYGVSNIQGSSEKLSYRQITFFRVLLVVFLIFWPLRLYRDGAYQRVTLRVQLRPLVQRAFVPKNRKRGM
jgi:hypothetical protein